MLRKLPKDCFLEVTFGYTSFPVGFQFIFCDLNMFKKSSRRSMYFLYHEDVLLKLSPNNSQWVLRRAQHVAGSRCTEFTSKWMARRKTWHRGRQLHRLLLPKSWRLQKNPSGASTATVWGLKCKRRTSIFQKPEQYFSQLCLPTHPYWDDLVDLVKDCVLFQILPLQWHQ